MSKRKKLRPQYFLSLTMREEPSMKDMGHGDQSLLIISIIKNDFEGGGTLLNPIWKNCGSLFGNREYDHLELRAYLSQDTDLAYGSKIAYWESLQIDSERAATMCRVLRRIDKKLKYFNNFEGSVDDIGTLAYRFCRAIGAEGIIEWTSNHSSYADASNKRWDVGQIKSVVNTRIYQWHCGHPKEAQIA
jgi:hypothetical protein